MGMGYSKKKQQGTRDHHARPRLAARAIVRAVITLAHALNREVVAEGVETDAQQDILVRMGCDQLQGFLFARPMPAHQLLTWVTGDDVPANSAYFRQAVHFNEDDRREGVRSDGGQLD